MLSGCNCGTCICFSLLNASFFAMVCSERIGCTLPCLECGVVVVCRPEENSTFIVMVIILRRWLMTQQRLGPQRWELWVGQEGLEPIWVALVSKRLMAWKFLIKHIHLKQHWNRKRIKIIWNPYQSKADKYRRLALSLLDTSDNHSVITYHLVPKATHVWHFKSAFVQCYLLSWPMVRNDTLPNMTNRSDQRV